MPAVRGAQPCAGMSATCACCWARGGGQRGAGKRAALVGGRGGSGAGGRGVAAWPPAGHTCFCSPSVMSTCERMQFTHMLLGLGRMLVPHRQQSLLGRRGGGGAGEGRRRRPAHGGIEPHAHARLQCRRRAGGRRTGCAARQYVRATLTRSPAWTAAETRPGRPCPWRRQSQQTARASLGHGSMQARWFRGRDRAGGAAAACADFGGGAAWRVEAREMRGLRRCGRCTSPCRAGAHRKGRRFRGTARGGKRGCARPRRTEAVRVCPINQPALGLIAACVPHLVALGRA